MTQASLVELDPDGGDQWPKDFVRRAADAWNDRHGQGSAPGNVIAGQFRRLRKAGAPWRFVIRAWRIYLATEPPRYQSPGSFCSRWRMHLEPTLSASEQAILRVFMAGDAADDR